MFPLSGNAASAGVHAKAAIEIAIDIINNAHPELGNFPLAKNAGLAGLGGAKVEVVFADNQGSPATGQNQALRLITEEKVVALTGAYQSGITLTASAIAEKYGIPYRQRRVGCRQSDRARLQMVLPDDAGRRRLRQDLSRLPQGHEGRAAPRPTTSRWSMTTPNTAPRSRASSPPCSRKRASASRIDVAYSANATDVQSQVLQLKEKKPDVVIMITYTSDAILFAKTMQALDYKPPMLIADDAGYSDPSFIKAVGKISQGAFNRSSWSVGPSGLADRHHRRDVQEEERRRDGRYRRAPDAGLLRAAAMRSTAPARPSPHKIQAALKATDLKPDQLMMGYKGVKFDDKGQNILASGLIIQLQDGENYVAVWPKDQRRERAGMPYKGW